MSKPSSPLGNVLWAAVGVLVALTLVVGYAHTPRGRPLLVLLSRWMSKGPVSCPLGYDKGATEAQRESARRAFAETHRGVAPARARPALTFILGVSTRGDVLAWAAAQGLGCDSPRGSMLRCSGMRGRPSSPQPLSVEEARFELGSKQELVGVSVLSRAHEPQVLSQAFAQRTATLARETGGHPRLEGDASARALAAGPLRQATAECRLRDYYSVLRATHVADGYVLTEDYRAL